jgi:uncharacterized membrane protein
LKIYQVQKNTITPKFGLRFFSLQDKREKNLKKKRLSHVTFTTWHPTLKALFSLTSQEKIKTLSHVYRLEVDSEHDARDLIIMISFTSQQFKHLSERDVSKKIQD